MAVKKATTEQETFNWGKASAEQIATVWPYLYPSIPVEAVKAEGQRTLVTKAAHGRSPEQIVQGAAERIEKARKAIPAEITALAANEIGDVLKRIGSRTNVEGEQFSGDNAWKLGRFLNQRLTKRGLTLEQARALPLPTGTKATKLSKMLPLDLANNEAPFGVPTKVGEFIQRLAQLDPNMTYGRSTNTVLPSALVKLPSINGDLPIIIPLGTEWKITKEQQQALDANADAKSDGGAGA